MVFGRRLQEHNKHKGNFKERYQQRQSQWQNNAMDVDTVQVNAMTSEEHANCMKEGCCFFYKDKGHMSKACPKKKNKPKTSQTWAVEVKATQEEEPKEDDKTNILSRVRKLSKEDRTVIFDEMLKAEGF